MMRKADKLFINKMWFWLNRLQQNESTEVKDRVFVSLELLARITPYDNVRDFIVTRVYEITGKIIYPFDDPTGKEIIPLGQDYVIARETATVR